MRWFLRLRQFSVLVNKRATTAAGPHLPMPAPEYLADYDQFLAKKFPKSKLTEKKMREKSQFLIELSLTTKKGNTSLSKPLIGKGTGQTITEARTIARDNLLAACMEYQSTVEQLEEKSESAVTSLSHPEILPQQEQLTAEQAGVLLRTICNDWNGANISEEFKNVRKQFCCILKITVNEEFINELGLSKKFSSGCGVGFHTTKAKAKSNAKIDLATRIAPYIKYYDHCIKGRPLDAVVAVEKAVEADVKHFEVEFPLESISKANSIFSSLQSSAIFEQTVSSKDSAARNLRSITRAYPSYSKDQLTKFSEMPIPSSFSKTCHLPIFERYHEILGTIESNQVTVLSAATGSGKTTQVPQFILSMYELMRPTFPETISPPSIICTQPRRIAAISVAQRIAAERGETMSADSSVGFSVRFQNQFPAGPKSFLNGRIVMCTAGILLKRLQSNPDLTDISHVIIDEVHERDVFSDILLMMCKSILRRRPNLKIILMSATLESDKFAEYFAKDGFTVGRVNDIGGTNYPVESVYLHDLVKQLKAAKYFPMNLLPESADYLTAESDPNTISLDPIIKKNELSEVPIDVVGEAIGWLHKTKPPGAILVFLPGWDEIVSVQDYLNSSSHLRDGPPHKLFVLHSAGPQQVTDDLFYLTPEYRKIILATNIAESSITIPDAVYVIDSGKQKTTFFDAKHRMNVLETCWLSRSNLKQRMGRAGRCQPGVYYSLMSKERADSLPAQVPPELARLNLDEVCLGVRAAGVTERCEDFLSRALDPPSMQAIKDSVCELQSIQAFDEKEQLTPLGRLLANIPIHPRTSKMLVTATLFKCVSPIESMVAAMGEKLTRSTLMMDAKLRLNAYLRRVGDNMFSDHLTVLKVFNDWCRGDRSMNGVFSDFGLTRMVKSQQSIHHTLSKAMFSDSVQVAEYDQNSTDKNLLRFILLSGFYPDLGKIGRRRNTIRLAHIKSPVMLAMTSVNSLPPSPVHDDVKKAAAHRDEVRQKLASMPPMYIYEELFDAGTKRVQKTTAIDPIWAAIFCESLEVKPSRDGKRCRLIVDKWIFLEGPTDSVSLLTELRHHYHNFIQFAVSKQLVGEALSDEEQRLVESFVDLVVCLVSKHTDIRRRLI